MTKILKLPQVMEVTSLSRSSIYAYIKAQKFPPQINIGVKAVGWDSLAIEKWLEDRIAASRSYDKQ